MINFKKIGFFVAGIYLVPPILSFLTAILLKADYTDFMGLFGVIYVLIYILFPCFYQGKIKDKISNRYVFYFMLYFVAWILSYIFILE
ncbi:MAG: hypothetical protein IJ019_06905 [Alphaproteobacteria bacterium]|nr:hypothetical protein [Alphaproteobacteria bacterium]